jgi:hypothetical protein
LDYKTGSDYYIHGPKPKPRNDDWGMKAWLEGKKRQKDVVDIPHGSRITVEAASEQEVTFNFNGRRYVTLKATFDRFTSVEKPKGE